MNKISDLDINCAVRKVLVRHWIDLGRISLRSTRGVVSLSGEISRLSNAGNPLDTGLTLVIFSEIRRIPNVRRVNTNLYNWVMRGDEWQLVSNNTPKRSVASSKTMSSSATPNVWEFNEKTGDPEDEAA